MRTEMVHAFNRHLQHKIPQLTRRLNHPFAQGHFGLQSRRWRQWRSPSFCCFGVAFLFTIKVLCRKKKKKNMITLAGTTPSGTQIRPSIYWLASTHPRRVLPSASYPKRARFPYPLSLFPPRRRNSALGFRQYANSSQSRYAYVTNRRRTAFKVPVQERAEGYLLRLHAAPRAMAQTTISDEAGMRGG